MFTQRYAILSFLLLFLLPARSVSAQDIIGDTIYASVDQQTTLYFPENVTFCDYYDGTAYSRFYKRVENSMVSLHAQVKNASPALLKISEGARNHLLILVYKEQLDVQELNHEWNDVGTLKDYVNTSLARKGVQPNTNERLKAGGGTAKNTQEAKTSNASKKSAAPPGSDQYWKDKYAEIKGIVNNLLRADTMVKERQAVGIRPVAKVDTTSKDNRDEASLKSLSIATKDSAEAEAARQKEALKMLNANYSNALSKAKSALKDKQYDSAKARFEEAITLKPGEQYPKEQLKAVNDKLAILAQVKRQNELYDSTISLAATALTQPPYENALQYFKDAKAIKPEEAYPVKMISYVHSLLADTKEKQKRADDLERKTQITYLTGKANEALTAKRYDTAKILLNEVLQLNPTPVQEEYARKKVEAIDMELQRIALATPVKKDTVPEVVPKSRREARVLAQRRAILAGASKEEARIKAEEEVTKLTAKQEEVKLKQAQDEELNLRKEQEAIAKQKADAKEVEDRKIAQQEEAKRIAATEKEAKRKAAQKEQEDLKLAKQEEQKRIAQQEEAKLQAAKKEEDNHKLVQQEEEKRKLAQQEKAKLKAAKKEEEDRELAHQEEDKRKLAQQEETKLKAAKKEEDDRKFAKQEEAKQKAAATEAKLTLDNEKADRQRKIVELMRKAYKEFNNKNYNSSRSLYSEVISMNPQKEQEDFSRKKIEAIDAELIKTTVATATASQPSATTITPAKEAVQPAGNPIVKQETSLSYTHQELLKKYPLINFDELPPGQTAETVDKDSRRQNFELSRTALAEPARLELSENNYDVRLTCQGITFSGANACVKLLIENKSEADFLTGTIQLTFIKNNGNLKQLNQRFISDFPVIKSGQQSQVIYIAGAPVNVAPDDVFIIEVNDRLKTTNLTLHISGSIYKEEKSRNFAP